MKIGSQNFSSGIDNAIKIYANKVKVNDERGNLMDLEAEKNNANVQKIEQAKNNVENQFPVQSMIDIKA